MRSLWLIGKVCKGFSALTKATSNAELLHWGDRIGQRIVVEVIGLTRGSSVSGSRALQMSRGPYICHRLVVALRIEAEFY
jgi:hypothetical protein